MKLKLKNWGKSSVKNQHINFNDFSGFLANSLISPFIYSPFREQDKKMLCNNGKFNQIINRIIKYVQDNNKVSIVMPVKNRRDTVKMAIDSVLEQNTKTLS